MITNTHSVGVVRDAVIAHRVKRGQPGPSAIWWSLPVVAETYDGYLNDVNGFHVKQRHAFEVSRTGREGRPVPEGNVGGGTGRSVTSSKEASGPPPGDLTSGKAATPSVC